ncbi:caspase-8 isoform X2 [Euwallacea fornicatus]|uniref:caspase-8 isoform X2 n=1 Tax=Euwallacea fornicatus TaxID=995702 RepID=UPI00338FE8FF
MGWGQSKYVSETDLSDDENEDVSYPTMQDNIQEITIDAVVPQNSIEQKLSLEDIRRIEVNELDMLEIISLIYLLYDNNRQALNDIEQCALRDKNPGFLYKWAQNGDRNWQGKFVEALCIIQNYKALKSCFGYNKILLQSIYMPSRPETTCSINHLHKVLYLIAEKLTLRQRETLVSHFNFLKRNINMISLEYYFLYLECKGVDFKEVQKSLKGMDLELLSSYLDGLLPVANSNNVSLINSMKYEGTSSPIDKYKPTTARDNTYLMTSTKENNRFSFYSATPGTSQERPVSINEEYYIDPYNPGKVLIINQESFYTETNPKFKDLLHEHNDDIQLEDRKGTNKDKERFFNCFINMNFDVIVKENLTHYDMIKAIEEVVDSASNTSSLVICILTHGDNGVVFGANSCKVSVKTIENIMCKHNKKLSGKPKLLILQSCQGKQCQKIIEEETDGYTTDGPKGPVTADLLTFFATIPGYAAVRNIKKGSWFIQALCDEIEAGNSQYHFLEICTRVVSKVTDQEWKEDGGGVNVMTPQMVSTLTKRFYLPLFKNQLTYEQVVLVTRSRVGQINI